MLKWLRRILVGTLVLVVLLVGAAAVVTNTAWFQRLAAPAGGRHRQRYARRRRHHRCTRRLDLERARRYVTPKTYVSVTQDQSGGGSREVQVQYYATPKWTFETSTTTEGDSGADVFWQTKY